jgi:protein-S-isoprenylcysteine O-methyltransferase Ste14
MEHLQSLTFLNIAFYVLNVFWLFEFVLFRNKSKRGEYKEFASYFILIFIIINTIIATILFSRNHLGLIIHNPIYPTFQILGLMLMITGLFLRYFGSYTLGRNFTRHVNVSSTMMLVSTGPYALLRHPLYLGLFLVTIAFPIYVGNYFVIIIFAPLLLLAMSYRMMLEEKALIAIHPSYKEWMKNRYRFIPFIY